VVTVATHPGIFSTGNTPSGSHVDAYTGAETPLTTCNSQLPANPAACRPRHQGEIAELVLFLTGSEWYLCNPCSAAGVIFELAPVVNGVVGAYVPQFLGTLLSAGNGMEKARVYLRGDLAGGEYRIRVRNSASADIPAPLTIKFGQPA
jgi:hypothetical protein